MVVTWLGPYRSSARVPLATVPARSDIARIIGVVGERMHHLFCVKVKEWLQEDSAKRDMRKSPPGGLNPLGGIAQSASVLQERRSLQDVSGDIATLLQPRGAGAAEMDSDQHARERVLARRIERAVVGTRQCGIRTGGGRSGRGVLKRAVGGNQGGQHFSGGAAPPCLPRRGGGDRRRG